jgi:ABC-type transporter Mla MlaB component
MSRRTGKREPSRAARTKAADTVAPIGGDLTIYHVGELRAALAAQVARGARRFDLSGVAEIDSSGLQLLAALRLSVTAAGGTPEFLQASAGVRAACALFGIDDWLAAGEPA